MKENMKLLRQTTKWNSGHTCAAMIFSKFFPQSEFADAEYLSRISGKRSDFNYEDMRFLLKLSLRVEIEMSVIRYTRQSVDMNWGKTMLASVQFVQRKARHFVLIEGDRVYDPGESHIMGFREWIASHPTGRITSWTVIDPREKLKSMSTAELAEMLKGNSWPDTNYPILNGRERREFARSADSLIGQPTQESPAAKANPYSITKS
jgi:hypothetical protein